MERAAFVAAGALVVVVALLAACGSASVAKPPYVGQPQSALVEVPYPPPPARVEMIPEKPVDAAVWIDGEWIWRGRRYAWKPGRWVRPIPGAAFSPWTTVRDAMGTLYLARGTWRDDKGAELSDPPPIQVGGTSHGTVVDPEGEEVPNAPLQPPAEDIVDSGLVPSPPADGAVPPPLEAGVLRDGGAGLPDAMDLPRDATPLGARTTVTPP